MSDIAILASPGTFIASLGAMADAHNRLGEAFASNPNLGDYARMQTRLILVPTQGERIVLAGGRTLAADGPLQALDGVRLIYLPSFQVADSDQLGDMLQGAAPLHASLRRHYEAGSVIGACGASVCHLAAAGLLDGRRAAVHPRLVMRFRQLFPAVAIDGISPVAIADRLMTCGPDAANPRLVFDLLAATTGVEVARSLLLREPDAGGPEQDPIVSQARQWLHERFTSNVRIADLADLLGVSHQTLLRRFRAAGEASPKAFVQGMRMDTAATMLAETRRSVAEIAQLVGYSDIAFFRQAFAARFGMAPGRYRRTRAGLTDT